MKLMFGFFFTTTLLVSGSLKAQLDCTLRKDSNGIKVYSCPEKDSKLKSIKSTFELDAEFSQLVSVIKDVATYDAWQYHMKNSKMVHQGENELTYYAEISAPWPVSNRDLIVQLQFFYDQKNKVLEVIGTGLPTLLPAVDDIVRVPKFKAQWLVREIGVHKLSVEYNLVIDIGGAIPVWLMNMAQAEGPYETFSNLKSHLNLDKYQGQTYPFLNNE